MKRKQQLLGLLVITGLGILHYQMHKRKILCKKKHRRDRFARF
jgi:hypothetical protein